MIGPHDQELRKMLVRAPYLAPWSPFPYELIAIPFFSGLKAISCPIYGYFRKKSLVCVYICSYPPLSQLQKLPLDPISMAIKKDRPSRSVKITLIPLSGPGLTRPRSRSGHQNPTPKCCVSVRDFISSHRSRFQTF